MIFIDNKLLQRIKRNDRKAMQELYGLTVCYLSAICHRYVVNEEDVRDVLQETYIKVFRNISSFEPSDESSMVKWMRKIAVNESLLLLRQKRKESFIEMTEDIPEKDEEIEIARFSAEELHNAIMLLPTGYRVVLNLYVFEEKSHKEIAKMLGIKDGSSASQLNRAKSQLRRILLAKEGGNR